MFLMCEFNFDFQILKEVRPNISDIIVSSDGSWNAAMEGEETTEKPEDTTLNTERDESLQPEELLDLTETDDPMDVSDASGTEDRRHSSVANAQTTSINPHLAITNDANQSSTHTERDYWAGIYMSTFGLGSLDVRPNAQTTGPTASTSNLTEVGAFHHNAVATTSTPQTGTPLPQYQQYQLGNSPVISDYGMPSAVPSHITRTASVVQALPAPTSAPTLQPSTSANAASSSCTTNSLSEASQASPAASNLTSNHASPLQAPPGSYSATLPQHLSIQKNHALSPRQNAGFVHPNQVPNMNSVSNENQSFSRQTDFRIPRATSQSSGTAQSSMQPSVNVMRPQIQTGVASTQQRNLHRTGVASSSTQQAQLIATANRAVQMSIGGSRAVPSYAWNTGAHNMPTLAADPRATNRATPMPQPDTTAQTSVDPNWRPPGRMRGALSGQAYADALYRLITHPTQQAQTSRPISNSMALPNVVQPVMPNFRARGNVQVVRAPNSASAAPVGRTTGPDILPSGSS